MTAADTLASFDSWKESLHRRLGSLEEALVAAYQGL